MKRLSAGLVFFFCLMIAVMGLTVPVRAQERPNGEFPLKQIDAYVADQMEAGQIPGLALGIIEHGEVVVVKGYGSADRAGKPVTPQTAFTVGSVGKTFTALCIRQLVNQGKLDYHTPVQTVLPWFTLADRDAAARIRIIDLIKHQSGISQADGILPTMYNGKYSIEQLVRKLDTVIPAHEPGTATVYSNLNYVILGHVVEVVSGLSYESYLKVFVFEPLGMMNSFPSAAAAAVADREGRAVFADGHYVMFGLPVRNREPLPTGQVPAGFQAASAEDLVRFASLYLNNGYVEGQSIIEANELPELELPFGDVDRDDLRYGSYWLVEGGEPRGQLGYDGHAGATNGYTSVLLIQPIWKNGIVVLTNCRNATVMPEINAQTIGNGLATILETGQPPAARQNSRPGMILKIVLLVAALALLLLRLFWLRRFSHSLVMGRMRKALALASWLVVDLILPAAILAGLPLWLDCSWPYLLNSNMELWYPLFTAGIILALTGLAKIVILIKK